MSQKQKELKRIVDEVGIAPLDLEDGTELPNLMGWSGMFDFVNYRARALEEIAESLGAQVEDIPGRDKF